MIYVDRFAYFIKLNNIHPIEKFIFSISIPIIVLTSKSIVLSLTVFLFLSLIIVYKASIPFKFYIKTILIPFYFLIIGIITIAINLLTNQKDILFVFNILNFKFGITSLSLYSAEIFFFKILGSVTYLYFLTLTVPMVELINIFKKLKFPKLFLELMIFIYRFIFVLLDTFDKIKTSQT